MNTRTSDDEREAELTRLEAMPDGDIDVNDIPEAPVENWPAALRGRYMPLGRRVPLQVDADVAAWFESQAHGRGYQAEIDRVLRRHMLEADTPPEEVRG